MNELSKQEIVLTEEQEKIFEAFVSTRDNLIVEAGPGSGKTFTIEHLFKHTYDSQKCLYLVFAKRNQLEAESKMPENVRVRTLHSFGLSIIRNNVQISGISTNKQIDFLKNHFKDSIKKEGKSAWRKIYTLDKVITVLRANLINLDYDLAEEVLDQYSLGDFNLSDLGMCLSMIRKLREVKNGVQVDMLNMIEMPALNDFVFPYFDIVACDESQDMSEIAMQMVNRIQSNRLIFIGDRRQSVFHFIGSKANSMEIIKNGFQCTEYPLSVSRRCSVKVCEEANKVFPNSVTPAENSVIGSVDKGSLLNSRAGDFILCRTNLPLVSAYYTLVDNGTPCTIIGKEIERGLKRMVKQFSDESNSVDALLDNLTIELYNLKEGNNSKQTIIEFEEKKETIEIISKGCEYISEIDLKIEDLFQDKGSRAVKLMTLHKSKGLEAKRVFIVKTYSGKTLLPHPSAETKEEKMAERFLEYVGITRAKEDLIYIDL